MLHLVEHSGLLVVVGGLCASEGLFSEGREPTLMRFPIDAGLTVRILAQVVSIVVILSPPRILGILVVIIGLEISILLLELFLLFRGSSGELSLAAAKA